MRRALSCAVLVVLLAACTSGTATHATPDTSLASAAALGSPSTARPVPRRVLWPPSLAPDPGWYLESSSLLPPGTHAVPFTAVSTIPFVDGPRIYPDGTAKELPTDGVVIYASLPTPDDHPRHATGGFSKVHLPPSLVEFNVEQRWEGQVAPNVPQYELWALAHRQRLELRIWFGTQHPSATVRAMVDHELHTLTVPSHLTSSRTRSGQCRAQPIPGTFSPLMSTNHGLVGSHFSVAGSVPTRSESGHYGGPTNRIEFWWNLDPDEYQSVFSNDPPSPAANGPVGLLGTREPSGQCEYRLRLRVPNVPPGCYTITPLEVWNSGSTAFLPLRFVVWAP